MSWRKTVQGSYRHWLDGFGTSVPSCTSAYSVGVWLKLNSMTGSETWQKHPVWLTNSDGDGWAPDYIGFDTQGTTTYVYFGASTVSHAVGINVGTTSPHFPQVGRWQKYIYVRNGTSGNALYHRGVSIASNTTALKTGSVYNWAPIPEGYVPNCDVGAHYYWNRALSDQEARLESVNMRLHPVVRYGLLNSLMFNGPQLVSLGARSNRVTGLTDVGTMSDIKTAAHPTTHSSSAIVLADKMLYECIDETPPDDADYIQYGVA